MAVPQVRYGLQSQIQRIVIVIWPLVWLLLASCGTLEIGQSGAEHNLASLFVTADASNLASGPWSIAAWSAQKEYAFDTTLSQEEYKGWITQRLGSDWHRCESCRLPPIFTRLLGGEQQQVEIRFAAAGSGRIRVHLTFVAMAT